MHRIILVDSTDMFSFCINTVVEIDGGERPAPYRSFVEYPYLVNSSHGLGSNTNLVVLLLWFHVQSY